MTKRLKREIAKCDVVCANCHRLRTKKQSVRQTQTAQADGQRNLWEAGYQSALVEIWKRQAEERDGEKAEGSSG